MIKGILFDCFGVLTTDTWRQFMEGLPPEADLDAARQAHRAYNSGLISKEDCHKSIMAATGGHGFTELDDAAAEAFTKNTQLVDYIGELHDRGFKISILSNVGSNWIREQFLTKEEQRSVDDYVLSYEVGMVKPEPQMYELACERLDVRPQEAIFIDDKEPYCEAARAVGLQAVRYDNFSATKAAIEAIIAAEPK